MVYGFPTQSGGNIAIESRLGYGTQVELVLPGDEDGLRRRQGRDKRAASDAEAQGRETTLVVEDETDVRTIASRFLSAIGYRVIAAASAREVLDMLIANPEVDVVLGSGMDGVELAH